MKARPILRWHGGKWLLAEWIIQHLPKHRVYVEPFGGAASVLLRKPRCYAEIYNDMDGEVVNLFRVARDHGDELRRRLELTPFAREEFVACRPRSEDPIEQARRTVVRAYQGFGSDVHCNGGTGFRANGFRNGTTPASDWMNYPSALTAITKRLQGVVIEQRDAGQVMQAADRVDTVHYVDPPYVQSTRGGRQRYRHELTDADHEQLAEVLHSLRGGVVLSGYPCALYDRLYGDWQRVEKATFADGARARIEVLWLSPNCRQPGLFMRPAAKAEVAVA